MIAVSIIRALELLSPGTFVDVDILTFRTCDLNECVFRGFAGSRLLSRNVRRYWLIEGATVPVTP